MPLKRHLTAVRGHVVFGAGGAVRVGPRASESPSPGVGTVGAGIVFSIGAPGDSVGVGSNAVGDGVGTSFGTAQLTLQRPVQLTLQRPDELALQRSSDDGGSGVVFGIGTSSDGVGVNDSAVGDGVGTNVGELGSIGERERCCAWLYGVVGL